MRRANYRGSHVTRQPIERAKVRLDVEDGRAVAGVDSFHAKTPAEESNSVSPIVINKLLTNAIKYGPGKPITVRLKRDGSVIRLSF